MDLGKPIDDPTDKIFDDIDKKEQAIKQAGFKLVAVEDGYILVKAS